MTAKRVRRRPASHDAPVTVPTGLPSTVVIDDVPSRIDIATAHEGVVVIDPVPRTTCLGDGLTIRDLGASHAALTQAIRDGGVIEVDCSSVASADVAGIQLLIAAGRGAAAAGGSLRLAAPLPDCLALVLRRGGFADAAGPISLDPTSWGCSA